MRGYTERTKKLREQSVSAQPRISAERAYWFTQAYKKYEGSVDIPVLRALAFKTYMENRELCINDGELIVGEKGVGPQCSPTFPELCCHTMEDLSVMNDRELISFKVDDETRRIHEREIMPYWSRRSIREKIMASVSEQWKDCYAAGMFTEFMEQRGPGHTGGGGGFYKNGFSDYKKKIEAKLASLDFAHDLNAYDKKAELTAMSIACDAIIAYGRRYSSYARELAEKETDPQKKADLMLISENCAVVPETE